MFEGSRRRQVEVVDEHRHDDVGAARILGVRLRRRLEPASALRVATVHITRPRARAVSITVAGPGVAAGGRATRGLAALERGEPEVHLPAEGEEHLPQATLRVVDAGRPVPARRREGVAAAQDVGGHRPRGVEEDHEVGLGGRRPGLWIRVQARGRLLGGGVGRHERRCGHEGRAREDRRETKLATAEAMEEEGPVHVLEVQSSPGVVMQRRGPGRRKVGTGRTRILQSRCLSRRTGFPRRSAWGGRARDRPIPTAEDGEARVAYRTSCEA